MTQSDPFERLDPPQLLPAEVPTSDSESDDAKKIFHDTVAAALINKFPQYSSAIQSSNDPEDMRKFVALCVDVIGWKHDAKKDPHDNLPIFNIVINGGAVQVQQVQPEPITIENDIDDDLPMLLPTSKMDTSVNADLGDLSA